MEIVILLLVGTLLLPLVYVIIISLIFRLFDNASDGEMTKEINTELFPYESIYPDKPKQ